MRAFDADFERIAAILGDEDNLTWDQCVDIFFEHLTKNLRLPCMVTGIEDFRWEEFYLIGPGDPKEYAARCKKQPSFSDDYDLLAIERHGGSPWMLVQYDLLARVRRKSDRRKFDLGLSELKAILEDSPEYQLLDDYAVWFANSR